jgi:hypothetical protein
MISYEKISLQPLPNKYMALTSSCEETVTEQTRVMLKKESAIYLVRSQHEGGDFLLKQKLNQMSLGDHQHSTDTEEDESIYQPSTSKISLPGQYQHDRHSPQPPRKKDTSPFEADNTCRLRMSDWSYKIVDFFGASRDIVAVAFNYLDRFMALPRHSCDSTFAYKLASITSIYIALKVYNRKTIKTATLSDLSRGEITVKDILAMEYVMLDALSYNLCPPTCYSFTESFCTYLPSNVRETAGQYILQEATFLAELSVMDLAFQGMIPSHISFASMLNVLDGIEETIFSRSEKAYFVTKVEECLEISHTSWVVLNARAMLWHVYRRSNQFELRDAASLIKNDVLLSLRNYDEEERDDVPCDISPTMCIRSSPCSLLVVKR